MSNRTNELYRANPSFREELEAEARKLRHEEVKRLVVRPLVGMWKRAVNNELGKSADRVAESV